MAWLCSRPGCAADHVWVCDSCNLFFCAAHSESPRILSNERHCNICGSQMAEVIPSPEASPRHQTPDTVQPSIAEPHAHLYVCATCRRLALTDHPTDNMPCPYCAATVFQARDMYLCSVTITSIHCHKCNVWLASFGEFSQHIVSDAHRAQQ